MSRIAKLAAASVAALLLVLFIATASHAGVVPTMFWRSYTWSCSPIVQSNGPYNPNYVSQCYTKNWRGSTTNTYYVWGRCQTLDSRWM